MVHKNWKKYVENTARIRMLSSPSVHSKMDALNYHKVLTDNFTEIRSLAKENREILQNDLSAYLVDDGKPLSKEVVEDLRELQSELMDAYNMENLDMTLVANIADRLYADANIKQDTAYLIEQLDSNVSAYYTLMNMQKRILPFGDACEVSRKKAFDAGEKLLLFLDKEKFKNLPDDDSKETVLVNARYMSALFEGLTDEASKLRELNMLRTALSLENDDFYREQVPEYDWVYHRMRTLEYFIMMMECGNRKGLTKEESEEVWNNCNDLYELWKNNEGIREYISEAEIMVGLHRSAYFSGKITKEEYKEQILIQYSRRSSDSYSINDIMLNVLAPLEYILLLDSDDMSEKEMHILDGIYRSIQKYVFGIPNSGSFSYLLEYYIEVMRHFIEVTGQLTFMEACLDGIAALHPPTYVHTIMVGRLSKCFCKNLIRLKPEAFVGCLGLEDVDSVKSHRSKLENFIYNGALCHDLGKIPIMDTIFTYGRNLTDDEFEMVKTHPVTGAGILDVYDSTRPYLDIAKGHHRWFDGSRGYPDFDTFSSPVKIMIDLVACADCLDAATDSVGRSYNDGKNYEGVFKELIDQSGTRYTPYIVDLLEDEKTREDVKYLLEEGRRKVYYNTFLRLMSVVNRDLSE